MTPPPPLPDHLGPRHQPEGHDVGKHRRAAQRERQPGTGRRALPAALRDERAPADAGKDRDVHDVVRHDVQLLAKRRFGKGEPRHLPVAAIHDRRQLEQERADNTRCVSPLREGHRGEDTDGRGHHRHRVGRESQRQKHPAQQRRDHAIEVGVHESFILAAQRAKEHPFGGSGRGGIAHMQAPVGRLRGRLHDRRATGGLRAAQQYADRRALPFDGRRDAHQGGRQNGDLRGAAVADHCQRPLLGFRLAPQHIDQLPGQDHLRADNQARADDLVGQRLPRPMVIRRKFPHRTPPHGNRHPRIVAQQPFEFRLLRTCQHHDLLHAGALQHEHRPHEQRKPSHDGQGADAIGDLTQPAEHAGRHHHDCGVQALRVCGLALLRKGLVHRLHTKLQD